MKRKVVGLSFLALFLLPISLAASEEPRTPTFEEILNLTQPGGVSISPDGRRIAYTVRRPDWEKNTYRTQIWMVEVDGGEPRQMTYSENSSSNLGWSPDSKHLSFVSRRGEEKNPQIYIMSTAGGEARKLTDSKTGIQGYKWSPDGKSIAYTASLEKSKRQKSIKKKYGDFDIVDQNLRRNGLWIIDVESEESESLVESDDKYVSGFDWAPDGGSIAFSANPDSRILSFSHSDIFLVEVESQQLRQLVDHKGPDTGPVFSPDGRRIAFTSGMGSDSYFVNSEIAVVSVDGGPVQALSKAFDEDPGLIDWKSDGIYFTAYQGMQRHLSRLDPSSKRTQPLTQGNQVLRSVSLSQDGGRFALTYVNADQYPEISWTETSRFAPKRLTDFSAQLDGWRLSKKEAISWKSRDGAEITGVLIKPADFDPSKKYPLMVIIHGGPTGISYPQRMQGYSRYYPIEQWAAKGALIMMPNYRGSAGFGEEFRSLNYRNLGVGDHWDVISGVDHLISQGFVDKDKVGSMGWSQGGYITAFNALYSDRFAAASVGAGISDWISYYYRTDITPFTVHYLGATPWDDPEVYRKTSPMSYINRASTPTLIQHGEFDRRVPPNNAYKLYRGLQDKGVESRLIIYKGFGHGISKPKETLAVLTHNWEWFNQHIWGEMPVEEEFEEVEVDEQTNPKR